MAIEHASFESIADQYATPSYAIRAAQGTSVDGELDHGIIEFRSAKSPAVSLYFSTVGVDVGVWSMSISTGSQMDGMDAFNFSRQVELAATLMGKLNCAEDWREFAQATSEARG